MNRMKKILSVLLVFSMMFAFAGCFFLSTDQEEFKEALGDVFNLSPNEYNVNTYSSKNAPMTGCIASITYIGNVSCYYYEFDTSENAHAYFSRHYGLFEDDFEYALFDGEYNKSDSGSRGYIYLRGTAKAGTKSFIGMGNVYGGIYFQDKTVVCVITSTAPSLAERFLNEIDYPHI